MLGEDLYRKGKKPYIEFDDYAGKDEALAAQDAWNRHLFRNESVVTDLFHGQFKSTVSCSKCDRVSVTFDPMMTVMLPIPIVKKPLQFFFVPYNIKEDYVNLNGEVFLRPSDTIMTLRKAIQ